MYSDEKYNVDGIMMDMTEIAGDVYENWKLCREKLYYMYGHNYSGGRHSVAMLALYHMNDLALTLSEEEELEAARHEQKMRCHDYMENKNGSRKNNRVA